MKKFFHLFLLPSITLCIGLCLGIIIRDFPKFKLIYEIKISDALQNIITLGVGVFVPLIVKKIIDDSRYIKSILITEIDKYEDKLNDVIDIFKQCYDNNKISQLHKENIGILLESVEAKLASLKDCLFHHMPNKLNKELQEITEQQNLIWKKLTGQRIQPERIVTIHHQLYDEIIGLSQQIHLSLIKLKTQIHSD